MKKPNCSHMRLAVAALLLSVTMAAAQENRRTQTIDLPHLARFVPAHAKLFVSIDRLYQLNHRIHGHDAWEMLLHVTGGTEASWQQTLAKTLGISSDTAVSRMFRRNVALAAPDWQHLGQGVILFTQSSTGMISFLVGPDQIQNAEVVGRVKIMRCRSGVWTAVCGSTVILAQQRGPNTFLDECVALLNRESKSSLWADREFRKRMGALPSPRDGCAFWDVEPEQGIPEEAQPLAHWWPPLKGGALSVRMEDHELQIGFRGRSTPHINRPYRPRVLLRHLSKLPQTTLVAWATSCDPKELFSAIPQNAPSPQLKDLWNAIKEGTDSQRFEENVVANIGPRCIVLLACDLTSVDLAPQIAVMIESVDPLAVITSLLDTANRLIQVTTPTDGRHPLFTLTTTDYDGTGIHKLQWKRPTDNQPGKTLASLVLQEMAVSVSAVDGWVVAATSPQQIRQIVDAAANRTQTLDEIVDLSRYNDRLRRSIGVAVVQPSLTLSTLRLWDLILQERRKTDESRTRLGVSVHSGHHGKVVIANVQADGPSTGVLQPGDAIIACNGILLDMDDPNDHLRSIVAETPSDSLIRLRLINGDHVFESVIHPITKTDGESKPVLSGLLELLAPLEQPLSKFSSVLYAIDRPVDGYLSQLFLELDSPSEAVRIP